MFQFSDYLNRIKRKTIEQAKEKFKDYQEMIRDVEEDIVNIFK